MEDIGFCYQCHPGRHNVQDVAKELDNFMCLFQVHTVRSRFCPEIGNGIQANNIRAVAYIHKQDLKDPNQDIRTGVVQVNLIPGKGGPDIGRAVDCMELGEDVRSPGAEDHPPLL